MTILMDQSDVRVTHGPNDGHFQIKDKSVASVFRALRTPFNISTDATTFVNGVEVGFGYRLRPGDQLEFCRQWGRKGGADERDDYFIRSSDVQLKLNEILFRQNRLEEMLKQVINQQAPPKEWYSVEEFAKLVDLAPYTVREHCRLDRLRAEKTECGRGGIPEWRIPHAELVRFRNHGLLPRRKNGG